MRNPEEIKAKYPGSNNTRVHKEAISRCSDEDLERMQLDGELMGLNELNTLGRHSSEWAFIFTDNKNNHGWTLILTKYHRKANVNGTINKWAENIFVYFTPTPNGLRIRAKHGKDVAWGFSSVSNMLERNNVNRFSMKGFFEENFDTEDFVPQAKYLLPDEHQDMSTLVRMSAYMHKLLAEQPGVKGVMNEIFKGNKHGVPKDIFNGNLNNPMTLTNLVKYAHFSQALSGYGDKASDWLRNISLNMDEVDYSRLIGVCKDVKKYGKFFNYDQHSFNKLRVYLENLFAQGFNYFLDLNGANDLIHDTIWMLLPGNTVLREQFTRRERKEIRKWYRGNRGIKDLHDYLVLLDIQKQQVKRQADRERALAQEAERQRALADWHQAVELDMAHWELEHEKRAKEEKVKREASLLKLDSFKGDVGSNIICVPPKSEDDMLLWGQETHTCIASYANRVMTGKLMCLAFVQHRQIVALAEISKSMHLSQLLGKYNKVLEDDIRNLIVSYLEGKGVDVSGNWIGSDEPYTNRVLI